MGTAAGTAAAGNDSRLAEGAAAAQTVRSLGGGATQAAAGNDARLSDARQPLDASVTDAKVNGAAAIAQSKLALAITDAQVAAGAAIAEAKLALATDAAPGTGSRRTLGGGANQAAAGNDSRIVNAVQPNTSPALNEVTLSGPVRFPGTIGAAILHWGHGFAYMGGSGGGAGNTSFNVIDADGVGKSHGFTGAFFSAWSDVKLKRNIRRISNPVDKLMAFEGKRHEWADADLGPSFGFLAGEVKAVMPEVVGYDETQGVETLDYMKMVPVLWEALKDSIAVIRDLRDRVTALETAAAA